MRHYELMIILDPDLEERTVTPSLETYLKIIKDSGGVVNKLDVWGKRRLSFEINKKPEGIYAVADMHCEPPAIKELDRQLNLNESILRTKVMRPE
jgi:small subunit ribosomal protein S6